MAAPKQKTRQRRQQIARATLALIARDGPSALSIAAVAREVGLTPSGLYRHFTGRDEMVSAAYALIEEAMRSNLREIEREGGTPLQRLRRLLDRHVALIVENPGIPRLVFSEQTYGDPERARELYSAVRAYLAAVSTLVTEAQEVGEIRSGVDPSAAATLFLGIIQPQALLWQMSGKAFSLEATTDRAWALLSRALVASDAGDERTEDFDPDPHSRGE